jgi:hypothetical protein
MKINFPNYVDTLKLPATKSLYPLFEAISNSIDAIEDNETKAGLITIILERGPQELLVDQGEEDRELLPIQNIVIEDNGIGFIDTHFDAFSELNSVIKKNRGGKGIGRVVWLKVFDYAEIRSTFYCDQGEVKFRHFNFGCGEDAVELISEQEKSGGEEIKTTVCLINCRKEFQEIMPKRRINIAQEIVIHFLPYFMVGSMPEIILKEEGLDDIFLWDVFQNYISEEGKRESFFIARNEFLVTHTKTKYHSQRNKEHRIFYVAHGRVVETRLISTEKIAHLPTKLQVGDDEYVYVGYVESPFLDKCVNPSRYTFDIPDEIEVGSLFEQVDWKKIEEKVNASLENYLSDYLEKARIDKDQKIKDFINEKAPNYSYIYLEHKDLIEKIPYKNIEKGNIGEELIRIHTLLKEKFSEEAEKVLNIPQDEIKSSEEYQEKVKNLLERMNPTGKADLAEYIIHRKTVLHLFDKALKIKDDGKFVKEDVLHNYVFPIKRSTDEIPYDKHNLWLLDERLAYNTYIASDKPFGQISGYEDLPVGDKRKRSDIYAYTFSTVEPDNTSSPFKSLDIFEFKRPMRDDYKSTENPYNQIKDYLEIIRQGSAITKDKRSFTVVEGGLIYCHVVCDFTPTLRRMLEKENFLQVGNQDWYIYYHRAFNAFIEVKSFELVLEIATKRNQILFDKLGLK